MAAPASAAFLSTSRRRRGDDARPAGPARERPRTARHGRYFLDTLEAALRLVK
jgi:hypothetical protein